MVNELDYQTIIDAKKGDEEAINAIKEYFEPYLRSMSYTAQYVGEGKRKMCFDEDLYTQLQIRLIHCIEKSYCEK